MIRRKGRGHALRRLLRVAVACLVLVGHTPDGQAGASGDSRGFSGSLVLSSFKPGLEADSHHEAWRPRRRSTLLVGSWLHFGGRPARSCRPSDRLVGLNVDQGRPLPPLLGPLSRYSIHRTQPPSAEGAAAPSSSDVCDLHAAPAAARLITRPRLQHRVFRRESSQSATGHVPRTDGGDFHADS